MEEVFSKRTIAQKKRHNPLLSDIQLISPKQIELVYKIREYRMEHSLTQSQFAKIATIYGNPFKIKFENCEISNYERFKATPSLKKMCIILKILGVEYDDLTYTVRM